MPNPAASGTATLLVLSQLLEMGEEEGWAYFDELVQQMSAMPDSGLAPTKQLPQVKLLLALALISWRTK